MRHLKRLIATRLSGKSKLPVLLLMLLPLMVYISKNACPFPLPDTGQTKCYDNSDEITCSAAGEGFMGRMQAT